MYFADTIHSHQIVDQLLLHGNIVKIYLVVGRVGQRIVISECICIFTQIIVFELIPGLFRRYIDHLGDLCSLPYILSYLYDPLIRYVRLEEDRDSHSRLDLMDYILKIDHHSVEQTEQKYTGSDGRYRRKRKDLVSEYRFYTLL